MCECRLRCQLLLRICHMTCVAHFRSQVLSQILCTSFAFVHVLIRCTMGCTGIKCIPWCNTTHQKNDSNKCNRIETNSNNKRSTSIFMHYNLLPGEVFHDWSYPNGCTNQQGHKKASSTSDDFRDFCSGTVGGHTHLTLYVGYLTTLFVEALSLMITIHLSWF